MTSLRPSGTAKLLQRILSDPQLPGRIAALEPRELARLIDEVGLEDSAEIVALASVDQIERVFDEDLWRASRPGADEAFDPERFGLWLEVLLELGAPKAAEKLAEMDEDFVTMALSQLIWVIDFESLQAQIASDRLVDKLTDTAFEIEDYLIFARDPQAWDAVLRIVAELDSSHHSFLRGILERCSHFTLEQAEEGDGLYSVLTAEESLREDVAFEREKRREAQGFVSPADARAFLKLAGGPLDAEDHVTPARLRKPGPGAKAVRADSAPAAQSVPIPATARYPRVHALLARSPAEQALRMEELAYLANVLVSGGEIEGRSPRPGEAAQLALETCEKGLSRHGEARSFIEAFRAGWTKS